MVVNAIEGGSAHMRQACLSDRQKCFHSISGIKFVNYGGYNQISESNSD